MKFSQLLTKLYARLNSMEQHKYLQPKFSAALRDITQYLGISELTEEDLAKPVPEDTSSTNSSKLIETLMKSGTRSELEVVVESPRLDLAVTEYNKNKNNNSSSHEKKQQMSLKSAPQKSFEMPPITKSTSSIQKMNLLAESRNSTFSKKQAIKQSLSQKKVAGRIATDPTISNHIVININQKQNTPKNDTPDNSYGGLP